MIYYVDININNVNVQRCYYNINIGCKIICRLGTRVCVCVCLVRYSSHGHID